MRWCVVVCGKKVSVEIEITFVQFRLWPHSVFEFDTRRPAGTPGNCGDLTMKNH